MPLCANCLTTSRGEVTSPRTCLQCSHPIVFNKRLDHMSDLKLMKVMTGLSANGALAYTENQLFHAIAGRKQRKPGLLKRFGKAPKLPAYWEPVAQHQTFTSKFSTWRQQNGRVEGTLIDAEILRQEANRQAGNGLPAEITVHSFDRVVVVDNVATAVMLVANNVHIDHRCAVFSEDGYPEGFRNELIQLLRTNPNLAVVALHGATLQSIGMAERLREWFPDPRVRIVDAGLRPSQADKSKIWTYRLDARTQPDPAVLADPRLARYSEAEREWLAWGLFAPLDSLSPAAVIAMLSKMFTGLARMDEDVVSRRRETDYDDGDYWDDYRDSSGVIWLDGGDEHVDDGLNDFFGSDFDGGDFFGDG